MDKKAASSENKVKTGIQGLDKALHGGIPAGNLVLISGGAGTGKSTLCLQFLINGAKLFGEKGLYISTEQTVEELHRQAEGFGWDLDELETRHPFKIKYFDITGGDNFIKKVDEMVAEFQPKRIVVDSMTTLTDALLISGLTEDSAFSLVQVAESVSPIPRTEQVIAKSILFRLIQELKKYGKTALLTSELPEEGGRLSADGISEFITDGVIVLHYLGIGATENRSMVLRKMRYSKHAKEPISYEIEENGIALKESEVDF